jgi:hypothetical protein
MFELLKSGNVRLEDAFTAAYDAIRLLQYRSRLKPQLYGQFLKEHEATASDEIIALALRVIREIEEVEDSGIGQLDDATASRYESALATLADERARKELATEPTKSKQLLQDLEREVVTR